MRGIATTTPSPKGAPLIKNLLPLALCGLLAACADSAPPVTMAQAAPAPKNACRSASTRTASARTFSRVFRVNSPPMWG